MHVIPVRNVANALPIGVKFLLTSGDRESSRAGPVLVSPGPVTTVYERPRERVLFSSVRNANPFFHLMESIWMLAGRSDAGFLTRYVKDFADRCAEPGGDIHGAYGHRWREHFEHPDVGHEGGGGPPFDQLARVVKILRSDPTSRQAVIAMWDPECDATTHPLKDRPCNTHVYLRVRDTAYHEPLVTDHNSADWEARIARGETKVLDMQINCRSNDIIWGAYGANAVHFSVLQEYLAARIGVEVGRLYQVSFNYHMYESAYEAMLSRSSGLFDDFSDELRDNRYQTTAHLGTSSPSCVSQPQTMFSSPDGIDDDCRSFCVWHQGSMGMNGVEPIYSNEWFRETAERAALAHWHHRKGDRLEAARYLSMIATPDWRVACTEWVERRTK